MQEIPQAGSPSGKVGGQSTSNDPNVPLNAEVRHIEIFFNFHYLNFASSTNLTT